MDQLVSHNNLVSKKNAATELCSLSLRNLVVRINAWSKIYGALGAAQGGASKANVLPFS